MNDVKLHIVTKMSQKISMEKYRVWDWQNAGSWSETVWSLMGDVLTPAVVKTFKSSPPEYVVGDDLTWLNEIVEAETGVTVDMHEVMAERLAEHYFALRAYHGTRPLDVDSFYKYGLRPLEPSHFEARARELFLDGSFPELSIDSIEQGIKKVGREYREGLLYFEANETHLVELCAHYMLYGSEYLSAIAANIPGQHDYKQHLKKFGTPTIFTCDIPFSHLDYALLKEFAGAALESMFTSLLDPTYQHGAKWNGAGLYIRRPLAPEFIVEHRTPSVLKDPLLGGRIVHTAGHETSQNPQTKRYGS